MLVKPVLFSSKSPSRPTPSCFPGKSGRAQDKQKHRPLLVETDPTHPVVQFRTGLPRPTRPSERAQHSAQAKKRRHCTPSLGLKEKALLVQPVLVSNKSGWEKRLVQLAQPVLLSMQTRAEIRPLKEKVLLIQPVLFFEQNQDGQKASLSSRSNPSFLGWAQGKQNIVHS